MPSAPPREPLRPIHFDCRWFGDHGVGRFARELYQRVPGCVALRLFGPKLSWTDPLATTLSAAGLKDGCYFSPGFNPPLYCPVPLAFTIHDLIHLRVRSESTRLRRLYYQSVVRPAAHRAWRVLTVSEYSRQDILDWTGLPAERVQVVGNGVSEAFCPSGPIHRPGYPYLLHVGRRASHKNVPLLIRAFAQSRARQSMRIVFTGLADSQTCEVARRAGVLDRVEFAGTLSDPDLAALYRGACALVYPSRYEGFGLPIIEAMACGTPVITSDGTSMAEVAGPGNAHLVAPDDQDALSTAIDALAGDAVLREDLRARGLQRATLFTWERVAHRVASVLAGGQLGTVQP